MILLVTSGGAENHKRLTVLEHQRRSESGAWTLARLKRVCMRAVKTKHL